MKKNIILGSLLLLLVLAGCGPSNPIVDDSGATAEGAKTVVDANNQFAFDLYNKYTNEKDGNIFFSPYSISSALAMTYEGAKGQTAAEMKSVFHFPESDILRSSYAKLYNEINKEDKPYQLSTANALWAQKDYTFLQEYFNLVENYYGGRVTNLDFVTETEKSRITINSWVEDQTNDKIKNLIPPGAIESDTRLVLTNAIYFKGTWQLQFDKKYTHNEGFRITPGNTVQVPMMQLTGEKAEFPYGETEDLQILEMPYEGNELSMLVLLPKDESSQIETLDAQKLADIRSSLTWQRVNVFLPKFKFETKYFMKNDLAEMGMPTAFGAADFSDMTGEKDLQISEVIHQAFVEVNEEGTEAAAATAVIMGETAARPEPIKVFKADHPFIFIIQQKETGNILFMGRMNNPLS